MSLIRKVRSVLKLFDELDAEIDAFQDESGLKCSSGCGECCLYPEIYATILEFLPFAYKMILQKKAFEILEILKNKEAGTSYCIIYSPFDLISNHGHCSNYENRGLICRLFGFSANFKKDGTPAMITCTIIKSKYPAIFKNHESLLAYTKHLPIASQYYSKLQSVDLSLSQETYPINIAIRKALEYVLSYYTYRKHPNKQTDT